MDVNFHIEAIQYFWPFYVAAIYFMDFQYLLFNSEAQFQHWIKLDRVVLAFMLYGSLVKILSAECATVVEIRWVWTFPKIILAYCKFSFSKVSKPIIAALYDESIFSFLLYICLVSLVCKDMVTWVNRINNAEQI